MGSCCLQISFIIVILSIISQKCSAQQQTTNNNVQDGQQQYVPYSGKRYEDLDWNLMKQLRTPDFGNVLISPLSLKLLLVMLYEGSSGDTEKEFQSVLHFPERKFDLRDKYRDIIDSIMKYSTEYTLDLGSRIYLDNSIKAQQRFQGMLKEFYSTDVVNINFSERTSRDIINYWVSNTTHGHIRDLVSESDLQDANMLLMNALYFKGLWRDPFPRNQTYLGTFYTAPRQPIQVDIMYNQGQFYYAESAELDAKILRLPFRGGHISMFIVLPNSKGGLPNLIKDLNSHVLRRHLSLMDIREVHVFLPKFTFDFNAKFGRILQDLGLNSIFQNTASLGGIARGQDGTKQKLMVTNVLQKSGITIDEEGSTAYAATEFTLANKFGAPDVVFNASNPFMFYIEDENTGSVLFAGKVENPIQLKQPPFKEELETPNRFVVPSTTEKQAQAQGMKHEVPPTNIK